MTWKLNPLGEVAKIGAGNSAPQGDRFFCPDGIPFFRTSDVGRIRFGKIVESADRLSEEGSRGLRLLPKGTILFPKSGASTFLNHRVMLDVDGFVSSHLATIVADESRICANYLLYFLATIEAQDLVQDHAYPSLNLPVIAGIQVPTPPLEEQHRIVALLDEAFAGIATAMATADASLRCAAEILDSASQNILDAVSGEEMSLESVAAEDCSLSYGIVQPGDAVEGGLPVVRPVDLTREFITLEGLKRIEPKLASSYQRTKLRGGELLLCVRGTTGTVSIAAPELEGANVTRGIVPIRFKAQQVLPSFGYHLMRSAGVQSQIREKTYGTALMQINIGDLRQISVRIPTLTQQQSLSNRLDGLREEASHLESLYTRKLAALDELKQSLLQRAFSGQL